jgi:hypothetical protein
MIRNENLAGTLLAAEEIVEKGKKKRRKRRFWRALGVYLLILTAAIIMLLSYLWRFLGYYEQTRPKHYMDDYVISMWKEGEIDELFSQCQVDWQTDDNTATVYTYLKNYISGKLLSYGKLPGYSELTPYYGIQADGETIATILLTSSGEQTDFGFNFWKIDSIDILLAGNDYYISIPSTLTAVANGSAIKDDHIFSTQQYLEVYPSGFPVNNVYKLNLYEKPQVIVTDYFGTQKQLEYDEDKELFYCGISYVTVPSNVKVYADNRELTSDYVLEEGIKAEKTFDFLYELQKRFKEYEGLADWLPIPTYTEYYIDFLYSSMTAQDNTGKLYELNKEEESNHYTGTQFVSDDSMKAECSSLAIEMADALAMYLTRDLPFSAVTPYLMKDSEYGQLLSRYDHCLQAHTYPTLGKQEILEYIGYSDNLVYVKVYLEQYMNSRGVNLVNKIEYPMWLIRKEGKWYVAGIDFTAFDNEYEQFF